LDIASGLFIVEIKKKKFNVWSIKKDAWLKLEFPSKFNGWVVPIYYK